jgi:hypothetical protein
MASFTTITTAQTLTAQYNNINQYTTVSVSSGPAAISNAFTLGYDPTLVSNGVIIGVGNVNGVLLRPGDNTSHTRLQNDGGASIIGYNAVVIAGTLGSQYNDTAATPTSAYIVNNGRITGTGNTGTRQLSGVGILFETGEHGQVVNQGGGTITGVNYGINFRSLGNVSNYVNNAGSISGGFKGIVFNDISFTSNTGASYLTPRYGTGTLINSGIVGTATESSGIGVEFDVSTQGAHVTNSGTIFGQVVAPSGGTLTINDVTPFGATITGGANFGSNSTLNLNGTGGLGTPANYIGFATINIGAGADFQLSAPGTTTTLTGNTVINNSGIVLVGGALVDVNAGVTSAASINMEATLGLTTTIDFTGSVSSTPIYDFGGNDDIILSASALPTEGAGSSDSLAYNTATGVLTVTETSAAGGVSNAFVTISEPNNYNSASFVGLQGPNGVNVQLGGAQLTGNTGSLVLNDGEHATLSNVALDSVPVTFGSNGTSLSPNVLQLNDLNQNINNAGATYTGNLAPISGFGSNDIITLGSVNIGAVSTDVITQTYDPTTGRYQIFDDSEYARTGNVNLSTDVLYFTPGSSYSSASFVDTFGTNGINIETPTTAAEQGYTFNASGTADINTLNDYSGMVAPGDSIVSGEVVTIASGTATFASTSASGVSSFFQNSGTILVTGKTSAFTDYATLTGGGTIVAANGGTINVFSATGSDAAQTLQFGTGGTSLALNMIDLNPTSGTFAGTIAGFGLNDDIVLGTSVLPTVATGSSVTLSYAGSLLTVGEVNSAGSVTASTTINVGTGYSTSSFVALLGTNGINIETPATVDEKPLTFVGTAGTVSSFEDPTKYTGGLAPGSTIVPGETVIIAAGTAAISSTAPVADFGTIIVSGTGSTLLDGSTLGGTGTAIAANGGTISITTSGTTDPVNFVFGTPGTSLSPNVIDFAGTNIFGTPVGTVSNLGTLDDIVLANSELPDSGYYAPGGNGYNGTTRSDYSLGQVVLNYNSTTGQIVILDMASQTLDTNQNYLGQYPDYAVTIDSTPGLTPGNFTLSSVAGEGFVVTYMPCFAAGTRILTGNGQVAVESIQVGDKVLTVRDGAEAEVVWVGQRTVDLKRHAMPEKVRPIRILAGAFGEGLPERDLRLSPDHALYIDGHLIEAKTLVNGVTVIEEKATRFVTYHHVELARHDIMLAEGLAAESYLDSGNRMMFESDAAPMMLHPDFAAASRETACAPLLTDGDVVTAARARLLERAVALGFAMTGAVDLTALVEGSAVTPAHAGDELLFVLPGKADSVELVSAVGVPAETSAQPGDRRSLGVAITGLALIAGGRRMVIALDDPAHTGFYEMENGHRWTNGAARVALPAYTGRAVLEVTINGQAARWVRAA